MNQKFHWKGSLKIHIKLKLDDILKLSPQYPTNQFLITIIHVLIFFAFLTYSKAY